MQLYALQIFSTIVSCYVMINYVVGLFQQERDVRDVLCHGQRQRSD
jgi:hypothetical protein